MLDVRMNNTALAFDVFRRVALILFTPKCFDNYFLDFNFLDGPCFTATLSKGLGLGIILGSLLVKLPQILKIFKSKSGEGINSASVSLDLAAITIYGSYSFVKQFPFTSYGDTVFLGIQTLLIAVLVLWYGGAQSAAIAYFIVHSIIVYSLTHLIPIETLWVLQSCVIPIVVSGKLVQAWTNYKNGSTGQLSAVTLIMLLAGSAARIFTSIQETGDNIVILTYISSTAANAVLVAQLLYYWNVDIKKKSE